MSDSHKLQDQTRFHTNLFVGEILRRARVHYNLSLEHVSADLRIRTSQLDAIERSAYDELPGRVYAIGFIRNYAEYLELDGEKIIALFKTQEGGRQTEPELNFPVPASESRIPDYKVLCGVACLLMGLVTAWFWLVQDSDDFAALSVPEVPGELEKKVSKAREKGELVVPELDKASLSRHEGAFGSEKHHKATAGEEKNNGIVFEAKADVWVEIRNESDEVILSKILKKGESYSVPTNQNGKLVMATGNAGGLEISIDGRTFDNLGAPGEVQRGVALRPQALEAFSKEK
jgi:cytoskeletal protein RodZ